VLIDAGAPDGWSQGYASQLTAAVKRQLPRKAALDTILCELAGACCRNFRGGVAQAVLRVHVRWVCPKRKGTWWT
jgi:hypothetical protein